MINAGFPCTPSVRKGVSVRGNVAFTDDCRSILVRVFKASSNRLMSSSIIAILISF